MGTLDIRYTLRLSPERVETFDLQLDSQTLELSRDQRESASWTALDYQTCPHCPLDAAEHPDCPLATSVARIVKRFDDVISYDELDVEVTTPQRTISKHTTSQAALRSLMGLLIACSGCPHTAFFKPMARFHLPFADEEETMFRAVGTWLVAQYFRASDGQPVDFELDGLQAVYERMQVVNRYTAERLRAATQADASLNAVVMLDVYAQLVPLFIHSTLGEVRGPFDTFLATDPG